MPQLLLSVQDPETGEPTAARFTLDLDGEAYVPPYLGEHGIRIQSIHTSKATTTVVTYARGTGPVAVPLPAGVKRGTVSVAKGLTVLPASASFEGGDDISEVVGHADVEVTHRIYAHALKQQVTATADRIDELFGRS